jgi:hypothetical protein
MISNRNKRHKIFTVLLLLATLVGCQSGPDLTAVQSFTSLRLFHVAFIDTYTTAPGKQWDDAKLQADIDKGDAMFSSATAGVTDQKRKQALEILYRQFQKDYTFLRQRAKEGKPFFSVVASQEKKQLIQENYDLANKGELVRF